MGTSYDRAEEIIKGLSRIGCRATTDPSALSPPAVLLLPPDRGYDIGCGYTARWTFVAMAPGAQGADRSTWRLLDDLVDAVAQVVPVTDAALVAYTVNGTTYPSFLITSEDTI